MCRHPCFALCPNPRRKGYAGLRLGKAPPADESIRSGGACASADTDADEEQAEAQAGGASGAGPSVGAQLALALAPALPDADAPGNGNGNADDEGRGPDEPQMGPVASFALAIAAEIATYVGAAGTGASLGVAGEVGTAECLRKASRVYSQLLTNFDWKERRAHALCCLCGAVMFPCGCSALCFQKNKCCVYPAHRLLPQVPTSASA